jgi:hypothetical protein
MKLIRKKMMLTKLVKKIKITRKQDNRRAEAIEL